VPADYLRDMPPDATPSVSEVVRAFEERRTVRGSLNHREHVMIGWHYARTRPAPQALAELARGIQELAVALGKEGLYHETLTWAWFSLIRERLERVGADASWEEFEKASPDLLSGAAIFDLYDRETLNSPLARRVFLMPDRRAPTAGS
jgi:hypothetical protein